MLRVTKIHDYIYQLLLKPIESCPFLAKTLTCYLVINNVFQTLNLFWKNVRKPRLSKPIHDTKFILIVLTSTLHLMCHFVISIIDVDHMFPQLGAFMVGVPQKKPCCPFVMCYESKSKGLAKWMFWDVKQWKIDMYV